MLYIRYTYKSDKNIKCIYLHLVQTYSKYVSVFESAECRRSSRNAAVSSNSYEIKMNCKHNIRKYAFEDQYKISYVQVIEYKLKLERLKCNESLL